MTRARGAPPPVRIIAGTWKGRRLDVPPSARPTSGRARQALFDLLGPERVAGARVLDLFAGSGAVGLEAVSRGAAGAVLVEPDAAAIRRTLARWAPPEGLVVVRESSAAAAVAALRRSGERFDVVFADPPYGDAAAAAAIADAGPLLAEGGVLVAQTDGGAEPPAPPGLVARQRRAYGRNVFHFFGIL